MLGDDSLALAGAYLSHYRAEWPVFPHGFSSSEAGFTADLIASG